MSRFYASIKGNRGSATRQGTKSSGMSGHIRGWRIGCNVWCYYDKEKNEDVVSVGITGGSSNSSTIKPLGSFRLSEINEGA